MIYKSRFVAMLTCLTRLVRPLDNRFNFSFIVNRAPAGPATIPRMACWSGAICESRCHTLKQRLGECDPADSLGAQSPEVFLFDREMTGDGQLERGEIIPVVSGTASQTFRHRSSTPTLDQTEIWCPIVSSLQSRKRDAAT